ncbi:MAG TPA: DUF1700 domain-containing protein [Virgibacillus sp.]|nr:DUF1700 domain-containing protein [Virgibacillus sp.]
MNEEQFLTELEHSLKKVPKEERHDMLRDYEEHFALAKEEGKSEEHIAGALGSPQKIAKELLATYHLEKAKSDTTTGNILRAVWAGIGIGFFNLVIVLGPFVGIAAIIISGWIVGVTFVASPLLALVDNVVFSDSFEWFTIFLSLALCGIGIFIANGMYYLTRFMSRGLIRYLKFNVSLVKGGLKHES